MFIRPHEYGALVDKYDTWLFDCDGVIWRGDHIIDGVIDALEILRERSTSHSSFTLIYPNFRL